MPPLAPCSLALAACVCLAGCGGEPSRAHTDSEVIVSALLDPSPPRVARHHMTVLVEDESGVPLERANVTARAEMPLHGHASSEAISVTDVGAGEYELYPITFTMPGHWQVVVEVAARDLAGGGTFEYEVE